MRMNPIDAAVRRWSLRTALLLGLVALIAALATTADAQDQPKTPHWFWGTDADAYAGDTIQAVNQSGVVVAATTVGNDGGWSVIVKPEDATRVTLQLLASSGTRETDPVDVIQGGFDAQGLSITAFKVVDDGLDDMPADSATLAVRIVARLHPTRPNRTLEFNLRVGGVDLDPPPAARYLGPSLATDRWYQSSPIDAGNGYEVRIIACKQSDDDVIFGLRVAGYDDIIPPARRLPSTITHNRWLRSSEILIPLHGDSTDVIRLGRGDIDCTAAPLAP